MNSTKYESAWKMRPGNERYYEIQLYLYTAWRELMQNSEE